MADGRMWLAEAQMVCVLSRPLGGWCIVQPRSKVMTRDYEVMSSILLAAAKYYIGQAGSRDKAWNYEVLSSILLAEARPSLHGDWAKGEFVT